MKPDFVLLEAFRLRGWPKPEPSLGLDAMFGEGGWCHGCGRPLVTQNGALRLGKAGLKGDPVGLMPNWLLETFCFDQQRLEALGHTFDVNWKPVSWASGAESNLGQLQIESTSESWFDREELETAALTERGYAGRLCPECNRWKWVYPKRLPNCILDPVGISADVVASPEWFGSGRSAFRLVLFRRPLADALAAFASSDFVVQEMSFA